MVTIQPDVQASETVSVDNIKELKDAGYDFAQDVRFRRDIWYLEFSFKPNKNLNPITAI